MRAAIAGSGFIARVHAIALRAIGVEVVAVCRAHAGGRAGFGERDAVRRSSRRCSSDEPVDVLHVCTPNAVHAAQALAAIERGIHVVCEKPLAVSTAESRRMLEAAVERGLVHATCYHVRGYPLVEQMRVERRGRRARRARIRRTGATSATTSSSRLRRWRIDPDRSGPSYVVGDLGTHWLDLAEHVTGAT